MGFSKYGKRFLTGLLNKINVLFPSIIFMLFRILPLFLLSGLLQAAQFRADFAIYDTSLDQKEDGVWKEEVQALKAMLSRYGWTFEILDFNQINQGALGDYSSRKYQGLIMPGGYSVPRLKQLFPDGARKIENFVKSGGGYLGFCAGTYYSSQNVDWSYNRQDYLSYYNYGSPSLFPGRVIGPMGWTPWRVDWYRNPATGFSPVHFNLNNPILSQIGFPRRSSLFYFGGPYFELPNKEQQPPNYEVWATAIKPGRETEKHPASSTETRGEGMPTIIRFSVEKGQAILFSYHPVILVDPVIDGVQVHEPIHKSILNRIPDDTSINEANYQSWNLLHAALSVISGRKIQPMKSPRSDF